MESVAFGEDRAATPLALPYTEQEVSWDDLLGILDSGSQAVTVCEGRVFVTPYAEGHEVDPNEVFMAGFEQGFINSPLAGGRHFVTRARFEELLGHRRRDQVAVLVTD